MNQLFFAFLNIGIALALAITVHRARENKHLKITLLSDPGPTVEKITLEGKGLKIAVLGLSISAMLFAFSGIGVGFSTISMETGYLITFLSGFFTILTLLASSYVMKRSS